MEAERYIYIQRDYSLGLEAKFHTNYPPELEGIITQPKFEQTIKGINHILAEGEKVCWRNFVEGCVGCLTGYLLFFFIESHYEKCLRALSEYIALQNETVWVSKGALLTDPQYKGLRVLEIIIFAKERSSFGTHEVH